MSLEKIRKESTLTVTHNLNELQSEIEIAPLLLITFVENAFKHVSQGNIGGDFIKIENHVTYNMLRFSVINSKGETAKDYNNNGIGLSNVQQRLKLLYPGKHRLKIKDEGVFYSINLTIQLI